MIDLMTAFYAAVVAVENGEVAEVEIMHQTDTEGAITLVTMIVRREMRPILLGGVGE